MKMIDRSYKSEGLRSSRGIKEDLSYCFLRMVLVSSQRRKLNFGLRRVLVQFCEVANQ